VVTSRDGDDLTWPVHLEPCGGEIYLVASHPIEQVRIAAADHVRQGSTLPVSIRIALSQGTAVDAVVPVTTEVQDAHGRPAEFSGHYGAAGGHLKLNLHIAVNDAPGMWTICVREGATGLEARHDFRVKHKEPDPD